MTIAKKVDHEQGVFKVREAKYVLVDLVSIRMYVAMVTLFFDLVCNSVAFKSYLPYCILRNGYKSVYRRPVVSIYCRYKLIISTLS